MIYPVMVFGMLGGDPNEITIEELGTISGWLHDLGYRPRTRTRFRSAYMMSVWVREETWPGDNHAHLKPYSGIMLRADPELIPTSAERAERNREWHRLLCQF